MNERRYDRALQVGECAYVLKFADEIGGYFGVSADELRVQSIEEATKIESVAELWNSRDDIDSDLSRLFDTEYVEHYLTGVGIESIKKGFVPTVIPVLVQLRAPHEWVEIKERSSAN